LIYGGRGVLGHVLVNHFKSNGWFVISVDLSANDAADVNVIVNPNDDWMKQVSLSFVAETT
jgi:nucleoside-diphosphate-sugar epimerase